LLTPKAKGLRAQPLPEANHLHRKPLTAESEHLGGREIDGTKHKLDRERRGNSLGQMLMRITADQPPRCPLNNLASSVFMTRVCGADPESIGLMFCTNPFLVHIYYQLEAKPFHGLVAKRNHVPEFPPSIVMEQGEGRLCQEERLAGKVQQHARVLAD
jgi:hypothetical protein